MTAIKSLNNWRPTRPNQYRSTILRLAEECCPAAVDFAQASGPRFEDVFDRGTACHSFLEHAGKATGAKGAPLEPEELRPILDTVQMLLVSEGRDGDSGPIPIPRVREGRELAERWIEAAGVSPTAKYEIGVAFLPGWQACEWDHPDFRYRTILDVLDRRFEEPGEGDEESGAAWVLAMTDYKTAWPTNESELETLQMKAQAVAAWTLATAEGGEWKADLIRQTVVNNRTMQTFSREFRVGDPVDADRIAGFKRELDMAMEALDKPRKARPGIGCFRCPYIGQCEPAMALVRSTGIPETPEDRVAAWCAARARAAQLGALLKEETRTAPIQTPQGKVGYLAKATRAMKPEGAKGLLEKWKAEGGDDRGFLEAAGGIGATAAEKVARKMRPKDRAAQAELLEPLLTVETKARFGVEGPADEEGDE